MKKIVYALCLLTMIFVSCNLASSKNNNVSEMEDNIPFFDHPFLRANESKYMTDNPTKAAMSAKYPQLSGHIAKINEGAIRLVKEIDNYPTIVVMQENKLYWIDQDSISTKAIHRFFGFCGNVTYYSNQIEQNGDTTKLVATTDGSMSGGGETDKEISYTLSNGESIDQLFFYNETKEMGYSDNTSFMSDEYLIAPSDRVLYGRKKNGKYNIFIYELNADSLSFKLGAFLPQDVDSISSISSTIGDNWTEYIGAFIFQQGELYGIFPGTTKAKYTSVGDALNTKTKLCRYTLPSGESGWLDMETGVEYSDI